MKKDAKIYIAGHSGLLGRAIEKLLKGNGYKNIITNTRQKLNLSRQSDVENFFKTERPRFVILAAAKVGGIRANMTYPAQFIYENIAIQTNIIHSAYLFGVEKLMFFGCACCYPAKASQPMREDCLLTGPLEKTNEPYAVAKIAGIKMCQAYNKEYGTNFITVVPANIYGPYDNFDADNAHVIPALIRKFHIAKKEGIPSVTIWGSGRPRREFIYVDDVATACVFLLDSLKVGDFINVGCGQDISIKELAKIIKQIVGFKGKVIFDKSRPDGMLQKLLDSSKMKHLGWRVKVSLEEGIIRTYAWYQDGR